MQVNPYRLGLCEWIDPRNGAQAVTKKSAVLAPFAMPSDMDAGLVRVRDHWLGLRRGQADIPFADDVKLSALQGSDADLMIIDVFEHPTRFRLSIAGARIAGRYGQFVEGLFADEIAPQAPLDYLLPQCSATVEGHAPTYYRDAQSSYARLMLPLWGDGHINSLLVAVKFKASGRSERAGATTAALS
jgi:hypothetical protein